MSRLFGPMRQVGIVVRDIDKAMRHWVEVCGVGPWFYAEQLPMTSSATRGSARRHQGVDRARQFRRRAARADPAARRRAEPLPRFPRRRPRGHAALVELAGELPRDPRARAAERLGRSARRATRRAARSSISSTRATPARSSRWPRRPRPACASSTQVREAALGWDGKDPIRMNWPQG